MGGRPSGSMVSRKPKRARPRPAVVPAWLLLFLAASLGGLLWVRRTVEPSPPLRTPSRLPQALIPEPPPFPETPLEERLKAPAAKAPNPPPIAHVSGSPATQESATPKMVLVIDDVGYHLPLLQEASEKLPTEITFAVLPHLPASVESAEILHRKGFPVILHAPMEPRSGSRVGPGQGALLVGMPAVEVGFLLDQDLASVPFAEGANNHMGSRATADPDLMREVMAFLRSKGLYFLDSRTTTTSVAYRAAREAGVPAAEKALFLDDEDRPESIERYFDLLVERARSDGQAVGIGHLRPHTVAVLAEQIPLWKSRGIVFVPLREVVR